MTIGDRGLSRLSGSGLRPFFAGLLAVVVALIAGLSGIASAAVATPAAEVQAAAPLPAHGSGYGYDFHSEFALPPAVQAEIGANDTVTNSAYLAASLGQVRRVLPDSQVRGVAPSAVGGAGESIYLTISTRSDLRAIATCMDRRGCRAGGDEARL